MEGIKLNRRNLIILMNKIRIPSEFFPLLPNISLFDLLKITENTIKIEI